jgi:hypothetical protein
MYEAGEIGLSLHEETLWEVYFTLFLEAVFGKEVVISGEAHNTPYRG